MGSSKLCSGDPSSGAFVTFIFAPQRVAELRQHQQISAVLVPVSDPIECDGTTRKIRSFYREIVHKDDSGKVVVRDKERVNDPRPGEESAVPAKLTVLLVEQVDVYGRLAFPPYRVLDFEAAKACGYKTPQLLREAWRSRHPRAEYAKLVWFCLGDWRDKDRFLQRMVSRGGDYTGDRSQAIDELPSLSEAQLQELAASNHQKYEAGRVERQEALSELTLAQRVARIEAVGDVLRREIRNELRIIQERAERARRRLAR